ncbi:hypothetical protein GJ496_000931 [Pomphorhynchus laevis]|nr:hypothetical protein GJ496_000931 [Pomphorhynchus laevis]
MVDNETWLPTYEELECPTLNVTSSVLRAGAHIVATRCDDAFKEFMLCRSEEQDARKCIAEGKDVTKCAIDAFKSIRDTCNESFSTYWKCLDLCPEGRWNYRFCKESQKEFETCAEEKMNVKRPESGYFAMTRLHKTTRAKPKVNHTTEFPFESLPEPPAISDINKFPEAKQSAELGERLHWRL